MVGCINGIVGGVAIALAGRSMLHASVPVAAAIGALSALVFASLFLGFQVRRLQRAGAMAPELFDWDGSGAAVYAERIEKRP
jgi:hypothetical protein